MKTDPAKVVRQRGNDDDTGRRTALQQTNQQRGQQEVAYSSGKEIVQLVMKSFLLQLIWFLSCLLQGLLGVWDNYIF